MAAVGLSADEARRIVAEKNQSPSIAAINGPTGTVLSGDTEILAQVLRKLESRDVFVRLLDVDFAFHSAQMDPLCDELTAAVRDIVPRTAAIPLISTVTGIPAAGDDFGPDYSARNIRQTVLFGPGIEFLLSAGCSTFMEISSQPVLGSYISQCVTPPCGQPLNRAEFASERTILASLLRGRSERETMLDALGQLYVAGYPVDWHKQHPAGGECVALPRYPWQRQRYWLETPARGPPGRNRQ